MSQQLTVFLALAFSIVIAIFAVQNNTEVPVRFLTVHVDAVAVSVLVLISAALGAAAMLLLGLAREISLRWRHRAVAQQLKTAQARVSELEAATGSSSQSLALGSTVPAASVPAQASEPAARPLPTEQ